MKITFLLPNINLRGGVRSVLEYADRLVELGEDVTVVFPTRLKRLPLMLNEVEWLWRAPHKLLFGRWWFSTKARVLAVPSLEARYIPEADVVVATAWQTAEFINRYPASRGVHTYFIQDIETYRDAADAARTYGYDFRRIVISPWIREQLMERFGVPTHGLVPLGVDGQLYSAGERREGGGGRPIAVGTMHDKSRRKGWDLALSVVERVAAMGADIQLHVLGLARSSQKLPARAVLHGRIAPADTPAFYRSCDIWLCASRSEGFYMPGMEALACGTPLVTSLIGGTVYYAYPEETALVADPGDEDGLVTALARLARDPALRARLGARGAERMRLCDIRAYAVHLRRALAGESVFVEPETTLKARHVD